MNDLHRDLLQQDEQRPGVLRFGGARMALLDVEAGFWALRRHLESLVGRRLADAVLEQAGAAGGASFARSFVGAQVTDGGRALRDCVAAYQAAGFGRFEVETLEWPIGRVVIRATDAFEAWTSSRHGEDGLSCAYTAGVLVGFVNVVAGRSDVVCVERACQAQGDDECLFELVPAEIAGDVGAVALHPDPAVRGQLGLLEMLFDRMPMGIAVLDRDYCIRRYNPTWGDYVTRYGPPSALQLAPGTSYFDVLPGSESIVIPLFERVLAGETIQQDGMRFESGGIVSYWDVVLAPVAEGADISGILNVTIDATVRIQALQELARTVDVLREREERLALVLRGTNDGIWDWKVESGEVYYSPRWKEMLGYADDEIADSFEAWRALIHPDDVERSVGAVDSYLAGESPQFWLEHRLRHKNGSYRWVLARGVAVRDASGRPTRMVGSHTDITGRKLAEESLQHQVSFENIVTSISTKFINLASDEVDQGIRDALQTLGEFSGVDRSYVFLYSGDRATMSCTHEWCAEGIAPQIDHMQDVPVDALSWSNRQLLDLETLYIPSLTDLPPEAAAERAEFERQGNQSLVAVPMAYRGAPVGFLGFDSVRAPKSWSDRDLALLKIVGEIVVNAIEHRRAQAIQDGQRQFLELLATGGGFSETLHTLVHIIEEQWPGMQGLILLLDEDGRHLHIGAAVTLPEEYTASIEGLEIGPLVGSCGTACYTRERVIVENIHTDPRWDGLRDLAVEYGLGACWSEPVLAADGRVIGTFAMYYRQPRAPTDAELHTIETAAHLVGIAIEHRRAEEEVERAYQSLERRVEERTHEIERRRQVAEGLRDLLAALNSNLPQEEVLGTIVIQAGQLLGADACLIYRFERDGEWMVIDSDYGLPPAIRVLSEGPVYATPITRAAQPAAITDLPAYVASVKFERTAAHSDFNCEWFETASRHYHSMLGVPLVVKGELYGGVIFYYRAQRDFSDEDVRLGVTLGDHAALAIENARLREQVEDAAASAERNRLARDLHDAVSQTLFSASLIAEVLPRLWERDPDEGRRRLTEMRELTRGALAEMRTLLLELRPAALVEADLADLLRQLAEAITGRARIPIDVTIDGEHALPVDVKVALYRIAQEALHNVAKHAGAGRATVHLCRRTDRVALEVWDDGHGFVVDDAPSERLGLGIMRERAEAIGAVLTIESAPGEGARVVVEWGIDDGR